MNKDYEKYLKVNGIVRDLKDFNVAELTPQQTVEGEPLETELSLVIANEYYFLFIVHLAMNESGQYFFGYDIVARDRFIGSLPKYHFNDNPETETLVRCVLDALDYCSCHVLFVAPSVRKKISMAAKAACRLINEYRLKQLTIFDMM